MSRTTTNSSRFIVSNIFFFNTSRDTYDTFYRKFTKCKKVIIFIKIIINKSNMLIYKCHTRIPDNMVYLLCWDIRNLVRNYTRLYHFCDFQENNFGLVLLTFVCFSLK